MKASHIPSHHNLNDNEARSRHRRSSCLPFLGPNSLFRSPHPRRCPVTSLAEDPRRAAPHRLVASGAIVSGRLAGRRNVCVSPRMPCLLFLYHYWEVWYREGNRTHTAGRYPKQGEARRGEEWWGLLICEVCPHENASVRA